MNNYYIYITTNPKNTILYVGMTNDLEQRLTEHYLNRGTRQSFAGRYYCYNLIYFERHQSPYVAIEREKEIKKWDGYKKGELIKSFNPEKRFLNPSIMKWPPHPEITFH